MLSEFDIIRQYFTPSYDDPQLLLGVGDDAALIQADPRKCLAISCDTLVAGTHFPKRLDATLVGHKALAVNLSDMAAMGATPKWVTLCLTLPQPEQSWLEAFSRGFYNIAAHFGLKLIGGDVTRGPLSISVQIVGEVDAQLALTRRAAKPGELILVTGTLGDAGAGLAAYKKQLQLEDSARDFCIARLHAPTPRVKEAQQLLGWAHAAIDISDGLAADLGHLLAASGVGAIVQLTQLPLSAALADQPSHLSTGYALSAGDDYELCFTIPPQSLVPLRQHWPKDLAPIQVIGEITTAPQLILLDANGSRVEREHFGYNHFGLEE